MKLERSKNTKRNIVFGISNKIITILLPFIVRTVIIKKIGSEYLGLNNLFSSILEVLNLTELGFSSAIIYSMYKPIANKDTKNICALLNFYKRAYRVIGSTILVLGIIIMPFIKYIIEGDSPENINLYVIYLIYLVNTALSYFLFAYKNSLLNAHQRIDIASNIGTITSGTMYIIQIIILCVTKNYYFYIIIIPTFTIINNLVNSLVVNKLYPQYICRGKLNKEMINEIKYKIIGLMINKLCYTTRNSFDSIFISTFLGLTTTAIYGNYYYIMNSVIIVLSVISGAMLGGVGNSLVLDSIEKNYSDMKKINYIYMWISGWCTICLVCLYQPFMKIWVGEGLMFPFPVVILFSVYFYSLKMGDIRGLYSDAAGLWWENRYRAIFEAIANLTLNLILGKIWGIYGIIIGTLTSLLIINFGFGSQIVFKYYFKNRKLKEYFALHLKYAAITIVICIITFILCKKVKYVGYMELITKTVICLIIPNLLYLVIYFRTSEYKDTISWLLNKLNLDKYLKLVIPK